ncbi:FAD-binding oxidoreductase [Amycolatopsis benzoatilytica]|uniref:FAD-binding oxidoreductase n=1 Tax=Amycolatopsis benzoatilytica TaxID=346045 RepID=UPI000360D450|nr:FAD-binding oxidoreductase [Amycolatopsis benzoatilytica]
MIADLGFQTAVQCEPDVVDRPSDAADVQRAISEAAERDLAVAIRGGGHGAVSQAGGMLIVTDRLDHLHVDPDAQTADVGAGVRWGTVVHEAARHGLAPLSGSSPTVGVAGYTLGGGLGPLSRRYGYAADHVHSLDLVTPDGQLRHLSADEPQLFWAVRGAGRSFGVATSIRVRLFPVDRILGGSLAFDPDRFADLLHRYREWTEDLPETLTSSLSMMAFPDAPGLPPHLRGRRTLRVFIAGTDLDRCARSTELLRAFGPVEDTVRPMRYADLGDVFAEPVRPHGYQGDAVATSDLDPDAVDPAWFSPRAEHAMFLTVHHLGGAMSRPASPANAVGRRDTRFLVRATSPVLFPAAPGLADLHRSVLNGLGCGSTSRVLNFVFGDRALAASECYDPGDYRRLTEIKREIDPANLFRFGPAVPPATP